MKCSKMNFAKCWIWMMSRKQIRSKNRFWIQTCKKKIRVLRRFDYTIRNNKFFFFFRFSRKNSIDHFQLFEFIVKHVIISFSFHAFLQNHFDVIFFVIVRSFFFFLTLTTISFIYSRFHKFQKSQNVFSSSLMRFECLKFRLFESKKWSNKKRRKNEIYAHIYENMMRKKEIVDVKKFKKKTKSDWKNVFDKNDWLFWIRYKNVWISCYEWFFDDLLT